MYFIGGGALLIQAVKYCLKMGYLVDGVCCPPGDSALAFMRNNKISVLETDNLNRDLLPVISSCTDKIVFSTNNYHIIKDELLSSGPKFFNIHNGLVQKYRGIPEVCIFAALCNGEASYGVTLHELLPKQKVDSGPVVAQISFRIEKEDQFSDLLDKTLEYCGKIFEQNIGNIISGNYKSEVIESAKSSFTYKNVPEICKNADVKNFSKANDFGDYADFFIRLRSAIDAAKKS